MKSIGFSFQKESNSIDSNRNDSSRTPEVHTEQRRKQQRHVSKEVDWDQKFQKLLEYKERHGDVNVPQRYNTDKLGTFVHAQRNAYKNDALSAERIKKLESIGFLFNLKDDLWNDRYEKLKQYKEKNGHCDVPYAEPLGTWVHHQVS